MKERIKKALELMDSLEKSDIEYDDLKKVLDNPNAVIAVYKPEDEYPVPPCINNNDYDNSKDEMDIKPEYKLAMNNYRYGGVDDIDMRRISATNVENINICNVNPRILAEDDRMLTPSQNEFIKEMREKNIAMTELMTEMYRRDTARLFEYITQSISIMAKATNKDMCRVINGDTKIEYNSGEK